MVVKSNKPAIKSGAQNKGAQGNMHHTKNNKAPNKTLNAKNQAAQKLDPKKIRKDFVLLSGAGSRGRRSSFLSGAKDKDVDTRAANNQGTKKQGTKNLDAHDHAWTAAPQNPSPDYPGGRLVYLDNAATTQKPRAVIDALVDFYQTKNANVDRGAYELSAKAGEHYGYARAKVMNFIKADLSQEIIFTRGTTESINLVAATFGQKHVGAGDEIIVSEMEHHSNLVPWQVLARQKKARLKVIKITDQGELDLDHYQKLLSDRTRLVAITHVSNVLGTINPLKEIIKLAHAKDVPVLVDGAQAAGHIPVDVKDLDCDFYAFSGHKVYGPLGIGVLYGKKKWLEQMPPYQTGGGMICAVDFEHTKFRPLPHKFEAGTPNLAGAIGLRAALSYVQEIGFKALQNHEQALLKLASELIKKISGVRIIGEAPEKIGVLSLAAEGVHPHDLGTILDQKGIAVRTGHHCAQPLSRRFGVPATLRASLAIYNTEEEIEYFARELKSAVNFLR